MQIHFNKTSCMTGGQRHRTRESPDLNIMIDNNKIKQVHSQKLLGMYNDEHLLWMPVCHNFIEDLPTKGTVILYSNGNSKNILSKLHSPIN